MYTAIIIILAIILLPLIIALFVKKQYNVQRSIVINQPVETVFDYIKYIRNQDNYSKWNMIDPNSKRTYTGNDATVGFIYSWDSTNNHAGAGAQEIVRVHENDRIATELRFERPFKDVGHSYMITESGPGNSTKVTWGFSGHNKYPRNLMNLMLDGMLGKDMNESLHNLKALLENKI